MICKYMFYKFFEMLKIRKYIICLDYYASEIQTNRDKNGLVIIIHQNKD